MAQSNSPCAARDEGCLAGPQASRRRLRRYRERTALGLLALPRVHHAVHPLARARVLTDRRPKKVYVVELGYGSRIP